ncbi:MAG TPA: TrkA C-terminal domain-containing protein, partial [Bacteroidales bacterium]|nr:TrkA C-terminal domain-containing protein [Bacteroidales bacterium]
FFISVTSVLIQGTSLTIVAKWLHVALPEKAKPVSEIDKFLADIPKSTMKEIKILPDCYAVNKKIVDLNFPQNTIIAMIKRDGKYLTPSGSTVIEANDILLILSDNQEGIDRVNVCLYKPNIAIK